jgi:hypothetical protein
MSAINPPRTCTARYLTPRWFYWFGTGHQVTDITSTGRRDNFSAIRHQPVYPVSRRKRESGDAFGGTHFRLCRFRKAAISFHPAVRIRQTMHISRFSMPRWQPLGWLWGTANAGVTLNFISGF